MPKRKESNTILYTHTGHPLTAKEAKFIDVYIATDNASEAVRQAGYQIESSSQVRQKAHKLKAKDYINDEIRYRVEKAAAERERKSIATAAEVMEFFTKVMNGEIKDQFGLEASLADRQKAAEALAKRTVDIEARAKQTDKNVTVTLVRGKKGKRK